MSASITKTEANLIYMYPIMSTTRDVALLKIAYDDEYYQSFFKYYECEHKRLMIDAINSGELSYDMTEIIELQEELVRCLIEYYELFIKQGEE